MPYLRDTRRSPMGIHNFRLPYEALNGTAPDGSKNNKTGYKYPDTIAIGVYFYAGKPNGAICVLPVGSRIAVMHCMSICRYPSDGSIEMPVPSLPQ
jgi:hypothetical protein